MPVPRYYLVRQDAVWLIKFEDEEYGPYRTEAEARNLAMDAIGKLTTLGEKAELLVTDEIVQPGLPH